MAPAGFQLRGHAVERIDQHTQFIDGADADAVVQPPQRHLLRGFGQALDGHGHLLGKEQRRPGGDEQDNDGYQRENVDVDLADVLELRLQALVVDHLAVHLGQAGRQAGGKAVGGNQPGGARLQR